jgi:Tol biopolymer transport system component
MHEEEFKCLDNDGRTASWSPDGKWLISHHKPINHTPPFLLLIEISTGYKYQLIELPMFRGDSYSTWSPDSKWIAYDIKTEGFGEIWIVDLEGNTHFLTSGLQPAWSPLGNEIAFGREGNIWIYDLDHEQERLVIEDPVHAGLPVWLSDGEFLLFESKRDGNSEIYRVDKYGENLGNLTNNPKEDFLPSVRPATAIK